MKEKKEEIKESKKTKKSKEKKVKKEGKLMKHLKKYKILYGAIIFSVAFATVIYYVDIWQYNYSEGKFWATLEGNEIVVAEPYYARMLDEIVLYPDDYADRDVYVSGTVYHPILVDTTLENGELLNKMTYVGIMHYWQRYDEYNTPGINCYFKYDNEGNEVNNSRDIIPDKSWVEMKGKIKYLEYNGEPYTYLEVEEYVVYPENEYINNVINK